MNETNETNNTELIQEVINEPAEKHQNIQEEANLQNQQNLDKNENNDPIPSKDPLEELKLIKERINNENKRIQEIDTKIDELRSNAQKKSPSKNLNYSLSFQNQDNDNNKSMEKISKNKSNILTDVNAKSARSIIVDENNQNKKKIVNIRSINKNSIDEENYLKLEQKEKQLEKEKKLKLHREKQLEIVKERKKLISQMNPISGFSSLPLVNKKKYTDIYTENEEKRIMREEYLLSLEKQKRKLKYSPISSEELNKFSDEVKKNEKQLKAELELKKLQMNALWKERKNLLPKYHSRFMEQNMENEIMVKEERIQKLNKIKEERLERMNFGKVILKNFQPKVLNDKLKIEREQRIKQLKGINRYEDIKGLRNKLKEKSNKLIQSQPKNFNMKNKFIIPESVAQIQAKKLNNDNSKVDYLLEKRKERSLKSKEELHNSNSAKKYNKWKKMLDNGNDNVYSNVSQIRMEADLLQDKAQQKKELLRQEKGDNNVKKTEELSQEITNLYIDSIQAKLQILNKIADTENKNNK